MVYRPKRKMTKFKASPSGTGIIKLLDKPKIGIKFDDSKSNKEFAGRKYVATEYPDYISTPKFLESQPWYIRLNNDGTKIFSVSPVDGEFVGRCIGLAREEGKPPVPKEKSNQWGDYSYFLALIEIVEGDCEGMVVTYMLRYNFEEDDGEVAYSDWGSDQAVHSPKLDEFLTLVGVWDYGAIPWADNVLPEIHKRITRANVTFKFLMKDGWIDHLWKTGTKKVEDEEDWSEDGWTTSDESDKEDWTEKGEPPWEEDNDEEAPFEWD